MVVAGVVVLLNDLMEGVEVVVVGVVVLQVAVCMV